VSCEGRFIGEETASIRFPDYRRAEALRSILTSAVSPKGMLVLFLPDGQ